MDDPVPVVIVGAGPTGVVAARLLAVHGVRSVVLDRWPAAYPRPRAVHLDDEVCRILHRAGVHEQFAAVSRPAEGLRLLGPDHRVLAQFSRGTADGVHGHPQANMFDQPTLEAILRRAVDQDPLVTLRGGVEVTAVSADGDGMATVAVTDRGSGERQTLRARYVLGCDGANSAVRAQIGSRMRDLGFAQRWLVVDVDTDAAIDAWEGVHQVCDPRRAATYMRVGARRYRWEFRLLPGETAAAMSAPQALHELVRPWTRDLPFEALVVVRCAEYTFRAQIADRWRAGPVFLLGDAAHLTPPFIGQGLGAGLRDAGNLTWKLAAVLAGGLPAAALDSYETERRPHVTALIRLAVGVGRAMTQGGEVGDLLRRLVAPRLVHVPGLRARVLDSTTPPLRRSALLRRRWSPWSRNGRLCPNLVLCDGRRLDDVLGSSFAVLTVGPLRPQVAAEARRRRVVLVPVEPASDLGRWLRRGGARAALVRPDRTVMRTGGDVAALLRVAPALSSVAPPTAPPPRPDPDGSRRGTPG
ncbi:bifunctional 3-(3-hydroxy-phenyl)propionate/3-hydroxycinnamic acid hydroxylase [Micromonospora sp. NBC_01412]|uniref:bifunctional 3-(3-hydroxy-phenyl)propionate/3-hydroxycinnamic acid hydroxylase MhpA n=1 Tax=Micromonospora sp. NBC_01412 TaxID=2903590 RepID=UPI00324AEEFA